MAFCLHRAHLLASEELLPSDLAPLRASQASERQRFCQEARSQVDAAHRASRQCSASPSAASGWLELGNWALYGLHLALPESFSQLATLGTCPSPWAHLQVPLSSDCFT